MATYIEIKLLLKKLLSLECEITEDSDLIIKEMGDGGEDIVIQSSELRNAYELMNFLSKEKLELYSPIKREVALQFAVPPMRIANAFHPLEDSENGIKYTVALASAEYTMFLLNLLADHTMQHGGRIPFEISFRGRNLLERSHLHGGVKKPFDVIPTVLRAYTLTVESSEHVTVGDLRVLASSFEFLYMYKKHVPLSECIELDDMYSLDNSARRSVLNEILDAAPQRKYNKDVLDYYTMALESKDPFTAYISYYHVIEHYFDAIYRKKLTEEIRSRITHPDFSYKKESSLYELAKFIKKRMNSDDSGKGNEFDSLKYVLEEYLTVEDLKKRINVLDSTAETYYRTQAVPFVSKKDTKIPWNDAQGIYNKLAARVYETRNALVHSKSEQKSSQYKPYENRKDLLKEIPLICAIAELVIINSSEIM